MEVFANLGVNLLVTIFLKEMFRLLIEMESQLLWSMSLGNSMDMGKGYDDMIGCATCSLSQRLMQ